MQTCHYCKCHQLCVCVFQDLSAWIRQDKYVPKRHFYNVLLNICLVCGWFLRCRWDGFDVCEFTAPPFFIEIISWLSTSSRSRWYSIIWSTETPQLTLMNYNFLLFIWNLFNVLIYWSMMWLLRRINQQQTNPVCIPFNSNKMFLY